MLDVALSLIAKMFMQPRRARGVIFKTIPEDLKYGQEDLRWPNELIIAVCHSVQLYIITRYLLTMSYSRGDVDCAAREALHASST